MYDIISNIIGHLWVENLPDQEIIYYVCGALIIILTCVFIDLIYRIFSHFWR